MKNYSIIEDLDIDFYQNFNQKNANQNLYDCFLRNYLLIRRYSLTKKQLLLSKFKKKIIPKYANQIFQYSQKLQQKHRRILYSKRRVSYEDALTYRKNRINSSQIINSTLQNQPDRIEQKLIQKIIKQPDSQPLIQIKNSFKFQAQSSTQLKNKQNKRQSGQESFKPFQISKQKPIKPSKISSQNKIQASIYNDSINFTRKIIFQSTLTKISRTRQQRDHDRNKITQLQKTRYSINQQQSIQKQMINILKQRKSQKKLKLKLSSSYLKGKRFFDYTDNNKENLIMRDSHEQNQVINQAKQKAGFLNFGLKGKLILPFRHKISNSCTFEHGNQKKIQDLYHKKIILDQKNNNLICQGFWPLKSSQRFTKTKRDKQLPKLIEITLQKFKKQRNNQKPFSLPKF